MNRMFFFIRQLIVCLAIVAGTSANAADTSPAGTQPLQVFRVGYLPHAGHGGMNDTIAHRLEQWMEDKPQVREALRQSGFNGSVTVQAADGHNDLRNLLASRQLEMAFCPAVVFASLRTDLYRVVFQEKRPGEVWDSRGGGRNLRQGVIIVGPLSPLFHAEDPDPRTLEAYLRGKEIAVPSAYDAAGYQYPLLAMANDLKVPPSSISLRFCGSSEEVVKQVVSGLADVGACDGAVLETWLPEALSSGGEASRAVRELPIKVPLVPSDPVILRSDLHPQTSELGRVIREQLPGFFRELPHAPFTLDMHARDEFYEPLWADLELFDRLIAGREASN